MILVVKRKKRIKNVVNLSLRGKKKKKQIRKEKKRKEKWRLLLGRR